MSDRTCLSSTFRNTERNLNHGQIEVIIQEKHYWKSYRTQDASSLVSKTEEVQWSLKMQTNSGINYRNLVNENPCPWMAPCANQGHLQGAEWGQILQPQSKEKTNNREIKINKVINVETEDYLYAKVKKRGWSNITPPQSSHIYGSHDPIFHSALHS